MKFLISLAVVFVSFLSSAQTCVGEWITIDDETNEKKSIVKLYKYKGQLYGKVTYIYDASRKNEKCTKCSGDRKNKPVLGLQIARNLKWNGSEWTGGTIVDPENGKVYSVKMWLDPDNPKYLNVRGYIGIFYRTQRWVRKSS